MNDYLTAISALELTRSRTDWTHAARRPARRRSKPSRIAALVHLVAPRRVHAGRPAVAAS